MAVAFTQGTQLGPDDLKITLKDAKGAFVDPYAISYSFYGKGGNRGVSEDYLIGQPYREPVRASEGVYYVGERVSAGFLPGSHYVKWIIKREENSPLEVIGELYFTIYKE